MAVLLAPRGPAWQNGGMGARGEKVGKGIRAKDELMAYARGGEGTLAALREALALGADPNQTVKISETIIPLLQYAMEKGDAEGAKILLEAGASADLPGKGLRGALSLAIRKSSPEMVGLILDAGARLDEPAEPGFGDESGLSALSQAIAMQDPRVVALLLARGADPNWAGGERVLPPLHVAARGDNRELCELLLAAGADVERVSSYHNYKEGTQHRGTAADIARTRQRHELADWLDAWALARREKAELDAGVEERGASRPKAL